ncbi:D-lactate dehydrogenase mitochondrial precursor [Trichodelitschia bisporula]|uniref:D-lactate dehydrogenase (cytochrome) n=1 Tax=Trichodelitschia bisporula TaxID=703511 RepID=A0A6G1HNX1_9PEZI|nr:D-lactate dehydrogenase mitochondrial precursor [Trichodelitschia bisporula]
MRRLATTFPARRLAPAHSASSNFGRPSTTWQPAITWRASSSTAHSESTDKPVKGGVKNGNGDGKNGSSFWTARRVLFATAFTGTLAYLYGVDDARRHSSGSRNKHIRKPTYGGKRDMENAIRELRETLGADTISTDDEDLRMHGYSEWSSINIDQLPVAVAYPKSTEEVSTIAKVCHKYRMPMIPYSGGSSLEANFSAPFGGMSIDFTYMDKVLQLHEDDMDVVVQPSVPWMSLNDQIKHSGLFFPVDPGPSARIGGMVGTSCSGTNAVRYGTMKDWVINLTVVLADGTVIKTRRRPRKSSAGYNLTNLFIGSEGTLGLVTEITLKLAVVPQETSVAVVTFPTIREAAAAASRIMRAGIPVAAMEIMDEVQMSVINRTGSTKRRWKEVPTMFFKFSGTKSGVKENVGLVKDIAKRHNCGDFDFAMDADEQATLWSARKEALWSMLALRKGDEEVWSTDVAVPLSRLPDIIEISKKEMDDLGLFASVLGHIGDGNFHESILYNSKDPKERAAVEACIHKMVDRALEMDGTCTGEHGVGLGKKSSLMKELGADTIGVMKGIKAALDPLWLMNPGKIMDMPN